MELLVFSIATTFTGWTAIQNFLFSNFKPTISIVSEPLVSQIWEHKVQRSGAFVLQSKQECIIGQINMNEDLY